MKPTAKNFLGVGIGLRRPHFDAIFETKRTIDWFEVISENFMKFGGNPLEVIERAKAQWPIVCHGVNLSLGSADPLKGDYLHALRLLVERVNAPWFSDHLCFASANGHYYHDLIPLPYTRETISYIIPRINETIQRVGRPFALENISYYTNTIHHEMDEVDFIGEILDKTDALLLLDINNLYVNAANHGFSVMRYLRNVPHDRIVQVHLAGHWNRGDILIDTHGDIVCDPVWELYRLFMRDIGRPVTTLIEWDNNIPPLETLLDQADRARRILREEVGDEDETFSVPIALG